ncbi:MAG TPA: GldG family protein [Vicinamibacterales bacterium]
MTTARAIAADVRRRLASRASWLTIALFALLAGVAFVVSLNAFLDQSGQALSAPPPEPINVSQLLIRPFLVDVGLAALLVLPLATARALTHPHARATAVAVPFIGTFALYALMLVAPAAVTAALFAFGSPEWGSLMSGFLGLLLIGAAFVAAALVVSSLSTHTLAAMLITGALSLLLIGATLLADSASPAVQPIFRSVSVGEVLDDFAKGVIDSRHIVSCLLVTALGLFLALQTLLRARADGGDRFFAGVAWLATVLAATSVAFVAITLLSGTFGRRWDLTANRVYQISPETHAALRVLDAPLRIRLSARPAQLRRYRDRLDEYAAASRRVSVEYADPDAPPARATQPDVQEAGTAVVEYKGRAERINATSEQDFTNALVRLHEGGERKVYFTAGHAERDAASTERAGYSHIAAALQHDNFGVEPINIAVRGDVPPDATVVVVAGPRADFFRAEIEALQRYVEKDGAILFMVDPLEDLKRYITESGSALFMMDPSSVSKTGELRNLTAFIRQHGAELGNDIVVDTSQMGQFLGTDASVPIAASYPPHPITNSLTALSAYPMARSVTPLTRDGATASSFITSGEQTWAETDIQQLSAGRLSMDPGSGDRPGPVSLGVAVSAKTGRLVVVGDSDFAANYSANVPGNAEIFLSMVRWLARDKVVTIPARLPQPRTFMLTASQRGMLIFLAVVLLPGLAAAVAASVRGGTRNLD